MAALSLIQKLIWSLSVGPRRQTDGPDETFEGIIFEYGNLPFLIPALPSLLGPRSQQIFVLELLSLLIYGGRYPF